MIFQSIQQLTLRLLRNFGKPLFNLLKCKKNNPSRSRKTPPCLKGIQAVKNFFISQNKTPAVVGVLF